MVSGGTRRGISSGGGQGHDRDCWGYRSSRVVKVDKLNPVEEMNLECEVRLELSRRYLGTYNR